jgi:hypothetical protein
MPPLVDLPVHEAKAIAESILGQNHKHLALQLAEVSKDCTLITMVGAKLIADGRTDIQLLNQHEAFRREVFDKFSDEQTGHVAALISPERTQRMLATIAATSPLDMSQGAMIDSISSFLGISVAQFRTAISKLEEAEIIVRRSESISITPDLLSDHILFKHCIDNHSAPTGFADEIFDAFRGICPATIIENFAELDWQLTKTSSASQPLLSKIWLQLELNYFDKKRSDQREILSLLKQTAYSQPAPVMRIVEKIIARTKYEELPRKDIAAILRSSSFTLDFVPKSCELLWAIGRDETDIYSNDNPLAVLKELCSFAYNKPVSFVQKAIDAVLPLLEKPETFSHKNSIVPIIEAALSKTIRMSEMDGFTVKFGYATIDYSKVQGIQELIITALAKCALSAPPSTCALILKSLEEALSPVLGSDQLKEQQQWLPLRLFVIETLSKIASAAKEPWIQVRILNIIDWHMRPAEMANIRNAALNLSKSIARTFELKLDALLWGRSDWQLLLDANTVEPSDWEKQEENLRALAALVAGELIAKYPNARDGANVTEARLSILISAQVGVFPYHFVHGLAPVNGDYALAFLRYLVESPHFQLANHIGILLFDLWSDHQKECEALVKLAIKTGRKNPCLGICGFLRSSRANAFNLSCLKILARNPDPEVRVGAIEALPRKQDEKNRKEVLAILRNTDVQHSDDALARKIAEVMVECDILPSLSAADCLCLLRKFRKINRLDDREILLFLDSACNRIPDDLVEFLLDRITRSERKDDFIALPSHSELMAEWKATAVSSRTITKILDNYHHSKRKLYDVAILFRWVTSDASANTLQILDRWLNAKSLKEVVFSRIGRSSPTDVVERAKTVADMLRFTRAQVILNHPLVIKLLNLSDDDEYLQEIRYSLISPLLSARDANIKQLAESRALQFDTDSNARKFYEWAANTL